MADKLLIVLANTDPDNGAEVGTPFFQATVAAAMEYDVEVILTGWSGKLAVRGVAEGLQLKGSKGKNAYQVIKDAHDAGVTFKVCTTAVDMWGEDLIPEIQETVGGAYVISEAMDDDTVTLTY